MNVVSLREKRIEKTVTQFNDEVLNTESLALAISVSNSVQEFHDDFCRWIEKRFEGKDSYIPSSLKYLTKGMDKRAVENGLTREELLDVICGHLLMSIDSEVVKLARTIKLYRNAEEI